MADNFTLPFSSNDQTWWVNLLLNKLKARGVPVDQWVSAFNDGMTITQEFAQAIADLQVELYAVIAGLFLPTSFKKFLTALVQAFFGLKRKGAMFTEGDITLANSGPDTTISVGEILVGTGGGGPNAKVYRNITDGGGRLPSGSNITIRVRAVAAGESYNVPNFSITDLKTPKPGVTVTNPPGPSGTWITQSGMAEEVDGTISPPFGLKGRAVDQWSTIGSGATAASYRYWALYPLPGTNPPSSPATRAEPLSDYNPDTMTFAPNTVSVFVAGPAGPVQSADVANIAQNFEQPVKRYPLNTKLYVRSVKAMNVNVAGVLYYRSNFQQADVASAVASALALYQSNFEIGAAVYYSEVIRVVMGANDEASIRFVLDTEADVPTGPGMIPVLSNMVRYQAVPVM